MRIHLWEQSVNEYWKQRSLTDDEFYFGLGDTIQARQQGKIPVAGEGAAEAMDLFGDIFTGIGYVWRPARQFALMFEALERLILGRTSIEELNE